MPTDTQKAFMPPEPNIFEGLTAESSDDEFIERILRKAHNAEREIKPFLSAPTYLTAARIKSIVQVMQTKGLIRVNRVYGNNYIVQIEVIGAEIMNTYGSWREFLSHTQQVPDLSLFQGRFEDRLHLSNSIQNAPYSHKKINSFIDIAKKLSDNGLISGLLVMAIGGLISLIAKYFGWW